MSNDYVEDSEPEREYIRMSQKARPKGRGKRNASPERGHDGSHPKRTGIDNRDIIDISSDISGIFASPATPARKVTAKERIIDISDSPENSFTSPAVPATSAPVLVTQSPVIDLSPIRPSRLGMYSHPGGASDDEGAMARPTLNRFALPPAQPAAGPSNTRKTSSRSSSKASTTPDPAPERPPTKRGRPAKIDLLGDLNETQLAGLLKCVCCDIKWTSRKSSAQKASHISTCARKNNMTAATVQSLIRKELDNAPPAIVRPARARKEAPLPPSQPPTHLEDIVNHAEPKKRGRRPVVAPTVQGPAVVQSDILDRARAVLHRENAPVIGLSTAIRRPLSTSGSTSPQRMPEATQPFARSALAGRGRSLFFADREEPLQENPPATQAFGASKLGVMSRLQAPAPIASTSAISVSSSSSDEPLINSANVPSPQARRSTRMSPLPAVQPRSFSPTGSEYFDYANDDFYNVQPGEDDWFDAPDMHDPEIRNSPPPLYFPQPTPSALETCADPGTSRIPISSADPDPDPDPDTPVEITATPAAVRKRAKKIPKKTATHVVLDDDAFEAEMKRLILADEALYLRILRFEPIHFDVFYEVALSLGVSDKKLRARVRTVLDKQVISHYGAEPGGKRTRKQRHP